MGVYYGIPRMLLPFCFSALVSSLGVSLQPSKNILLLVFTISGFILCAGIPVSLIIHNYRYVQLSQAILAVCLIFQLVSGLIWLTDLVGIDNSNDLNSSNGHHIEQAMVILFILNQIISFISLTTIFMEKFNHSNDINDLENDNKTLGHEEHSLNQESFGVTKKISEQTLVDQPIKKQMNSTTYNANKIKHISEESNQLSAYSDIIKYSIEGASKGIPEEDHSNWMDSGTKLHTLTLPTHITEIELQNKPKLQDNNLQRKPSFNRLGLKILSSTGKKSSNMNNLINTADSTKNLHILNTSKSVPNFPSKLNSTSTEDDFIELKSSFKNFPTKSVSIESIPQSPIEERTRRVSLIETTSDHLTSDLNASHEKCIANIRNHSKIESQGELHVKRSKSTSYISGRPCKIRRSEERWKSINDEKVFLLQVNESLLPSVLKTGESPIMASKRRQQEFLENDGQSPYISHELNHSVSPAKSLPNRIFSNEKIEDDNDDENLPYIDEFEETIDQTEFCDFTQDTLMIQNETATSSPRGKKKPYKFGGFDYDTHHGDDLDGLETIPKSSTKDSPLWNKNEGNIKKSYISAEDWENNAEKWNESRKRIGSSTHGGVKLMINGGVYTPEVGNPKSERPPFLLLNRSFSAPSLHTFRDVSGSSKSSGEEKIATNSTHLTSTGEESLSKCRTPTDQIVEINEPHTGGSSSPIKRFFQESPKRLSSALRRQSTGKRQSFELGNIKGLEAGTFSHKHNSSLVSNPYSVISGISSKSGSPKKSFKQFLNKNSYHKKHSSVPSVILAPSLKEDQIQPSSWYNSPKLYSYEQLAFEYHGPQPIDMWDMDLETTRSSNKSRVSSLPGSVIGEYDKEKWRTMKSLQNNETVALKLNTIDI